MCLALVGTEWQDGRALRRDFPSPKKAVIADNFMRPPHEDGAIWARTGDFRSRPWAHFENVAGPFATAGRTLRPARCTFDAIIGWRDL